MTDQSVTTLMNIGNTVASRLQKIGVSSHSDLKKLGAAKAYRLLSKHYPGRHLPVCYYLYSLEGALQNRHWDDLSDSEKTALRTKAGLSR